MSFWSAKKASEVMDVAFVCRQGIMYHFLTLFRIIIAKSAFVSVYLGTSCSVFRFTFPYSCSFVCEFLSVLVKQLWPFSGWRSCALFIPCKFIYISYWDCWFVQNCNLNKSVSSVIQLFFYAVNLDLLWR